MADLRTFQPSFNGGGFSPSLHARVDLAKYATGLRQGKNVFVHAHGGVSNRAGLRFVGAPKYPHIPDDYDGTSNGVNLIPFQFNDEQSYLLEFGHFYMRIYKKGGLILKNGNIYEIATPYRTDGYNSNYADPRDLSYVQEADVMYLAHPHTQVRKLMRLAEDDWVLTEVNFTPSIAVPTGVGAHVVVNKGNNKTYSYVVSAIDKDTGEESLPSNPA